MHKPDTALAAPLFSAASLRPLGSMLLFVAIATLALFGAATLATVGV